jgi:hypothetical protein
MVIIFEKTSLAAEHKKILLSLPRNEEVATCTGTCMQHSVAINNLYICELVYKQKRNSGFES